MKTINLHEIENYHLAKSVLNYNIQICTGISSMYCNCLYHKTIDIWGGNKLPEVLNCNTLSSFKKAFNRLLERRHTLASAL